MKNPVMTASGTFGYGREYSQFIDLNKLGGIITKGTSLKLRPGNPAPRICEVPGGMLNSIGLQNPGVEYFAEFDLPWLRKFDTKIIVNACGSTIEDYVELCRILNKLDSFTNNDFEKILILENSIENCWLSVYELKNKKASTKVDTGKKNNNSVNPNICNSRRKYTQSCDIG